MGNGIGSEIRNRIRNGTRNGMGNGSQLWEFLLGKTAQRGGNGIEEEKRDMG